ncbi:hypothetical protein BC938DRAFT_483976 [Jimgerdemannia flammicorona]|uniref:Uncharacterized protein n=1 Tax=Jimgerdemannia flammicorona TaxID=994334 RepID=A0A433QAZ3_9FUNG|nr:hypothetical protein BC938DRAFT_483976 [Jimgerdemannia flammicorona]
MTNHGTDCRKMGALWCVLKVLVMPPVLFTTRPSFDSVQIIPFHYVTCHNASTARAYRGLFLIAPMDPDP